VDAATFGAVGTILVGLAAAIGAWIGKRGENRATHQGVVMTGYGGLVNELQEERADLRQKLTEAHAELARERADQAALLARIAHLETEIAARDRQIAELTAARGGPTP
jgi:septal ring factor EnvC (AmiA/AmiB activator)